MLSEAHLKRIDFLNWFFLKPEDSPNARIIAESRPNHGLTYKIGSFFFLEMLFSTPRRRLGLALSSCNTQNGEK
jgi:hypothetical protein